MKTLTAKDAKCGFGCLIDLARAALWPSPEDPDEYRAANICWVPKKARWSRIKGNAPQPTVGKLVDDAMEAVERDNPSLKDVLPKDYPRPALDKQRLGSLINLVSRPRVPRLAWREDRGQVRGHPRLSATIEEMLFDSSSVSAATSKSPK
jgi:type I restriction-modification system DNA methylase subunit